MIDIRTIIEEEAAKLDHPWIITDALREDPAPDIATYREVIEKIRHIETTYTADEIYDADLLCELW